MLLPDALPDNKAAGIAELFNVNPDKLPCNQLTGVPVPLGAVSTTPPCGVRWFIKNSSLAPIDLAP